MYVYTGSIIYSIVLRLHFRFYLYFIMNYDIGMYLYSTGILYYLFVLYLTTVCLFSHGAFHSIEFSKCLSDELTMPTN